MDEGTITISLDEHREDISRSSNVERFICYINKYASIDKETRGIMPDFKKDGVKRNG